MTTVAVLGADLAGRLAAATAAVVGCDVRARAWDMMTFLGPHGAGAALGSSDWDRVRTLVRNDPVEHREYVEMWHLLRGADHLATMLGRTTGA